MATLKPQKPTYLGRLSSKMIAHPGSHHFQVPRWLRLREEVDLWCEANFGVRRGDGTDRWYQVGASWVIFGDVDAMAFRLRWC